MIDWLHSTFAQSTMALQTAADGEKGDAEAIERFSRSRLDAPELGLCPKPVLCVSADETALVEFSRMLSVGLQATYALLFYLAPFPHASFLRARLQHTLCALLAASCRRPPPISGASSCCSLGRDEGGMA